MAIAISSKINDKDKDCFQPRLHELELQRKENQAAPSTTQDMAGLEPYENQAEMSLAEGLEPYEHQAEMSLAEGLLENHEGVGKGISFEPFVHEEFVAKENHDAISIEELVVPALADAQKELDVSGMGVALDVSSDLIATVMAAMLNTFGENYLTVSQSDLLWLQNVDTQTRIGTILSREFKWNECHLLDSSKRKTNNACKVDALIKDLQGRRLDIVENLMLMFENNLSMVETVELAIMHPSKEMTCKLSEDVNCLSEEKQAVGKVVMRLHDVPLPKSSILCCIDDDFAAACMCLPLVCSAKTEVQRLRGGMKHAVSAYHKAARLGLQNGPYIIANHVTRTSFDKWISNVESTWKVAYFYNKESDRGSVFLYGDPSYLHERISFWFEQALIVQASHNLKCELTDIAMGIGCATQTLRSGSRKEPDASFTSLSAGPSTPARVILEVAYMNENLEELIREIKAWHDAGVLTCLGVKIEAEGNNMYWVKQCQQDPVPKIINFSPTFCSDSNRTDFQIRFPFSDVTEDFDLVEDFHVVIDLYKLQRYILNCLDFEAKRNHEVVYIDESGRQRTGKDVPCPVCDKRFEEKFMIMCPKCRRWYHVRCVGLDECKMPPLWCCSTCCV